VPIESQRENRSAEAVTVLSISADPAHHAELQRALSSEWRLRSCAGFLRALSELRRSRAPLVLWDCDSMPSSWRGALAKISFRRNAPSMILTSRAAGASLWAEALNLGAWDVLARPFDAAEVSRVLAAALNYDGGPFTADSKAAAAVI